MIKFQLALKATLSFKSFPDVSILQTGIQDSDDQECLLTGWRGMTCITVKQGEIK